MGDPGGVPPVIDAQSATVTVGSGDSTYTVHPAEVLPLHAAHPADGATMRRFSTHYACSCPAWRFHRERNVRLRSCKHLEAVLGEEYERVRLKAAEQADSGAMAQPAARPRSAERRPSSEDAPHTPSRKRARPSVPEDDALFVIGPDEASVTIGRRDVSVNLLLANVWPGSTPVFTVPGRARSGRSGVVDPTGWWLSEKLDGVRAYWDGHQLWSRRGKLWNAPAWFTDPLPSDMCLDGELWIGRGLFEYTSGICRALRQDEWKKVKFMIFDTPTTGDTPVEERWARITAHFRTVQSAELDNLETWGHYMLAHEKCTDQEHLDKTLQRVLDQGGEGIMLRQPRSRYEFGRSRTLYKLKPTLDGEARVIGYEEGQNQAAGKVGALVCETLEPPPRRFKIGSGLTAALREHPPPVGSVVSYWYGGLGSQNIPRFPRYRGVVYDK